MKALKVILVTVGILVVLGLTFSAGAIYEDLAMTREARASTVPLTPNLEAYDIESRVNSYRLSQGLQPLMHDDRLCKSADAKNQDMVTGGYWAHNSPSGKTPFDFMANQHISYAKAGENLAKTFDSNERVVTGWIGSPKHQENMVGDFTSTCVSQISSANGRYVTQHFIKLP